MTELNISNLRKSQDEKTLFFNFFYNGKELISNENKSYPVCGMSLKKAGSMRFRWNEINENRLNYLGKIEKETEKTFVPVELIHSKTVYSITDACDTKNLQGDGIITPNSKLIPTVTVADCMPVYLYDVKNDVFGIVHSGWKGTGICVEAINQSKKIYNSSVEDFCVVLGPHIESCCYIVNEERAQYFAENFCEDCVTPLEKDGVCYAGGRGLAINWNNGSGQLYRLSLGKANLAALKKAGVRDENITIINECTCCNEIFGSNRRETALFTVNGNADASVDKTKCFTVQAAFIYRM